MLPLCCHYCDGKKDSRGGCGHLPARQARHVQCAPPFLGGAHVFWQAKAECEGARHRHSMTAVWILADSHRVCLETPAHLPACKPCSAWPSSSHVGWMTSSRCGTTGPATYKHPCYAVWLLRRRHTDAAPARPRRSCYLPSSVCCWMVQPLRHRRLCSIHPALMRSSSGMCLLHVAADIMWPLMKHAVTCPGGTTQAEMLFSESSWSATLQPTGVAG